MTTYGELIPAPLRHRWSDRKIARARYSMSLFVWYFGTDRRYPEVPHHTILVGARYRELLRDIFERKVLADDFSLYLHRPTATDPNLAPSGCDAFYVLSPVPHLGGHTDWHGAAEPYRQSISRLLSATLLPDLERHVVTSRIMTPLDFRDRLSAPHGAAFGLAPELTQSAWFRPHNRSEDVQGLYLVGAGTHPGAGVPGVLSSARVLDTVVPDAASFKHSSHASVADVAACRASLQGGSKTFFAASLALPHAVRQPATALLRTAAWPMMPSTTGRITKRRCAICIADSSGSMPAFPATSQPTALLPTVRCISPSPSNIRWRCSRIPVGRDRPSL